MTVFKSNRAFKRKYTAIFQKDPVWANMLLLLCEMADRDGKVIIPDPPEEHLLELMAKRFNDPRGWQL
jgi:hypothetical protein